MLTQELDQCFPHSNVLSASRILYPQYWLQEGAEDSFPRYLQILKNQFCGTRVQCGWTLEDLKEQSVGELLSASALDIQQPFFKDHDEELGLGVHFATLHKNPLLGCGK